MDNNGRQVFVDRDGSFSLSAPPQWVIDTRGQAGTAVVVHERANASSFAANVNVIVQQLRGLSSDEFLTLSRLQLKHLTGQPRLQVDAPAAHSPGGHLFEWSAPFGAGMLHGRQLIVITQDKAFVVTATAPAATFDAYRAEFDSILDSFQLLKPEYAKV
jgi:hypothetical protein